jgi:methionine biosynthesis protein MetW
MESTYNKTYNKIWERKGKIVNQPHKKNCPCRSCEASKLFDGGNRFLDIGCGTGFLISLLAKKYMEYYGVDISSVALEKATEDGVQTFCLNVDKEDLPFENNFFDSAVCLDVIEHVFNPYHLIDEINRVLKPGSDFVIATPNIRYFLHIASLVFLGRFPKTSEDTEAYDGGHIHYFTRKNLEDILRSHGFRIVKISFIRNCFIGDFRYPGVFVKAKKL